MLQQVVYTVTSQLYRVQALNFFQTKPTYIYISLVSIDDFKPQKDGKSTHNVTFRGVIRNSADHRIKSTGLTLCGVVDDCRCKDKKYNYYYKICFKAKQQPNTACVELLLCYCVTYTMGCHMSRLFLLFKHVISSSIKI